MQHKEVYLLFCKFTLHVSGVNHTHHPEYTKTVTTVSGTGNIFLCSYLPPTWPSLATLAGGSCTVRPLTEAVVTVLFTPDDGCGWHPEHVEWTCRIINRLLCVATRWTIINLTAGTYQSIKTTNKIHEFPRKKFKYPINEKSMLKLCDSGEYAWNCPKHEYSTSSTQNLPQQKSSKWKTPSSSY